MPLRTASPTTTPADDGERSYWGRWIFGLTLLIALVGGIFWQSGRESVPLASLSPSAIPFFGERHVGPHVESRLITKPIEEIELGERVLGQNPEVTDAERATFRDPNPLTWRKILLRHRMASGNWLGIELLRPLEWFIERGARVGGEIEIALEEMRIAGPAEVLAIEACPPIQPGEGRVVTGRFIHMSEGDLVELRVEGLAEPIVCNDIHRFWCANRQQFVAAGDLRSDDEFLLDNGTTVALRSGKRLEHDELLFNLEVDGEHVFQICAQGYLVHNTYSARTLAEADFHRLVQDAHSDLIKTPLLLETVLSERQLHAWASNPNKLGPVFHGIAVENLVAQRIDASPTLSGLFERLGGPNRPDFAGKGRYSGLNFDATTAAQIPAHLERPYGNNLIFGIHP